MKVPSRREFAEVIKRAKKAGQKAGRERFKEIRAWARPGQQVLDVCGGARLILRVHGESRMGKFLSEVERKPLSDASITRWRARQYSLHIWGMVRAQEQSVHAAAVRAALAVIQDALGVKGHVRTWID